MTVLKRMHIEDLNKVCNRKSTKPIKKLLMSLAIKEMSDI